MAQDSVLFGKYQSLRKLVVSPAGEVHLAQAKAGGHARRVVVKILNPPITPERTEPFCCEARATAPTLHPNILRPLDFGVADGRCYVAIEAFSCAPLTEVLAAAARARRRLSFEFVSAVASQVCAGLAHAHSRNTPDGRPLRLVHSDLSPGHLVAVEGGVIKMVGFAFAQGRGLVDPATRTDQGRAAAYYLAPEQLQACREVDARADLFALGAVLWELVAGKGPFQATTLAEVSEAYEHPAAPLTLVARDVPLDLADAVARALEMDPAARYSSADEMRRAFDAILARRGTRHPAAVVDEELKALQRFGLAFATFEDSRLPDWYRETLGFDPTAGALPAGTALEEASARPRGGGTGPQVAELFSTEPASGSVPLNPDESWNTPRAPAAGLEPVPKLPPESLETRAVSAENAVPDEGAGRWGTGALVGAMLASAVIFGAAGFYGAAFLRGGAVLPARVGPGAEAVPAGQVQVLVTSSPGAGKVFLDGVDTGLTTPAKLVVAAGRRHVFLVQLADYVDWTVELEPRKGDGDKIEAALVKAARIKAASEPGGAMVEVDALPAFQSPGASPAVKAGAHKVVFRKQGFMPLTREVTVRDGEEPTVAVNLVPAAEVAVKSVPSGAEVFVDGEATGLRTPATVPIAAGKAAFVSVRKPGCIGGSKKVPALEQAKTWSLELGLEDVVHGELIKRSAARQRDLTVLTKKRDDAKRKFDAKRNPVNEKALRDAQEALDDVEADVAEMGRLMTMHGSVRR